MFRTVNGKREPWFTDKERYYQVLLRGLSQEVGSEILRLDELKKNQLRRLDKLQKRAFREVNRLM